MKPEVCLVAQQPTTQHTATETAHSQLLELLFTHEFPKAELNGTSRAEFEELQAALTSLFAKVTWLASHTCREGVHSATVLGKQGNR